MSDYMRAMTISNIMILIFGMSIYVLGINPENAFLFAIIWASYSMLTVILIEFLGIIFTDNKPK